MDGKKTPDRFVVAENIAKRYGWTLEYIKTIPNSEMDALINIISTENKLEKNRLNSYKKNGG